MQYTVGSLARKFGLSRSTLLYYDAIGLLCPEGHEKGDYRRYSERDRQRLEQILRYRQAGIALKEIARILEAPASGAREVLERRFADLGREIEALHEQQRLVAGLLQRPELLARTGHLTKERWMALLEKAGFSGEDMRRWHVRFERSDPDNHRQFLEYLHIPGDEITLIRQWAAAPQPLIKVKEVRDRFMEIFMEVFENMTRQGPGSLASTRRALGLCADLPEKPAILDIGCGSGAGTLMLLAETAGTVTAVDRHGPFLRQLERRAERNGVWSRVHTVQQDMEALDLPQGSYDLIWSEGAIYLMGFDRGLAAWKPLLKPGGLLAVSEACWFTDQRPEEAVAFWREGYPAMRSVSENVAALERAGYQVLGYFQQPDSDWTELFYRELGEQLLLVEEKYGREPEAQAVVESNRREMEIFDRWSATFGYAFFVARAH